MKIQGCMLDYLQKINGPPSRAFLLVYSKKCSPSDTDTAVHWLALQWLGFHRNKNVKISCSIWSMSPAAPWLQLIPQLIGRWESILTYRNLIAGYQHWKVSILDSRILERPYREHIYSLRVSLHLSFKVTLATCRRSWAVKEDCVFLAFSGS